MKMKWFWFPVAVVATAVVLLAATAMIVAFPARAALASTLGGAAWNGGSWHGGPWGKGSSFTLPPQLQGLADVPADQRFAHVVGAHIDLKDKDGNPLTIVATPGTVTASSATSLALAANDGSTKTFVLNDQTILHGQPASGSSQPNQPALARGDSVVVVTLNQSSTATAVLDGGSRGFGWSGPGSS